MNSEWLTLVNMEKIPRKNLATENHQIPKEKIQRDSQMMQTII